MSKVLVTGGTGYIGSHTMVDLIQNGHQVISVDNHINSYEIGPLEGIENITGTRPEHYTIDLCDKAATQRIFLDHPDIDAIIHFAALKAVGESTEKPMLYFDNNMKSLINILALAQEHHVKKFIFSSSCTVYGQASDLPVTEETEMKEAESPYGRTKQLGEYMLKDLATFSDIQVISLRYFNPAGAHHSGHLGEAPKQIALNLVPVITETAANKRASCTVFGNDYDTRDGSCVRDFIHVEDLASAHTCAVEYLINNKNSDSYEVYNLGIGDGVTVLEAIHAFEKVSGVKLNYNIGPRRPGDVIAIYSNYEKARKRLGWIPKFGIEEIMRTAWEWEMNRPY
jgi:UDP-glucose 4-epimerase